MGHSRKDPHTEEISAVRRGRGEKNVSDNSKCIRTSKGGRGLTSYFLRGGGMDVFWNDPIKKLFVIFPSHIKPYSNMIIITSA